MKKKELSIPENKKQQELNSRKFIESVEMLKKTGVVKFDREIIDALEWNKATFSSVMNGRKLIPIFYFQKFNKVYGIEVNNSEEFDTSMLIKIDAKCDVILSAIAEILAYQKGHTADKIKDDLIFSVNKLITVKTKE